MIPNDSCLWVLTPRYSPSHIAPGLAYGTKEYERSDGMPLLRLGDKSHCSCDIGHSLSVITSSEGNQLPCHEQLLERHPPPWHPHNKKLRTFASKHMNQSLLGSGPGQGFRWQQFSLAFCDFPRDPEPEPSSEAKPKFFNLRRYVSW